MKFSTVDQDNDPILTDACTLHHPGGWWFSRCLDSNLNGVFDAKTNTLPTLYWKTISQAIVKTEMKIQAYKKGTLIYVLLVLQVLESCNLDTVINTFEALVILVPFKHFAKSLSDERRLLVSFYCELQSSSLFIKS